MQPGQLAVFLEGSQAFTSSIENAHAVCRNSKTEASHLRQIAAECLAGSVSDNQMIFLSLDVECSIEPRFGGDSGSSSHIVTEHGPVMLQMFTPL